MTAYRRETSTPTQRQAAERFLAPDRAKEEAPVDRPRLRLVSFKPLVKGALRGFAAVALPNGLTIGDCPLCVSSGKAWAALPSKPVLDRDGRHAEIGGKRQYVAILNWPDRGTHDRWSEAVVALVLAQHPEALS